jgi:transposase InsO family protein
MSTKNNTELVQNALTMAIWRRGKVNNVIVHSDQDSTYASKHYRHQLMANNLYCSMSRKGGCWDNAVAENFFGSLHEDYQTRKKARQRIFEYIEVFYNRKKIQAFLNYMSPVEYEEKCAGN